MNHEQNEANEFTCITDEELEAAVAKYEEEEQDLFNEAYERRQGMAEEEEQRAKENDRKTEEEVDGKKAKKKVSRSKAFHTSVAAPGVTLTEKQVDFMMHLPDTCFWENGLDSNIWIDVLCDEIGGQFENKPMTVGAMISTLCEKGLGVRCKQRVNGHKSTSFALTEAGKKVAEELGL
jgi:hypothetical protein